MMVVLVVQDKDLHLIIMLAGEMQLQQVRLALLLVRLMEVALLVTGTIVQVASFADTFTLERYLVERGAEKVRQDHGIQVYGHTPFVILGSVVLERVVRLLKRRCRDSASANTKKRRIVFSI
jgi:hypothetical protein